MGGELYQGVEDSVRARRAVGAGHGHAVEPGTHQHQPASRRWDDAEREGPLGGVGNAELAAAAATRLPVCVHHLHEEPVAELRERRIRAEDHAPLRQRRGLTWTAPGEHERESGGAPHCVVPGYTQRSPSVGRCGLHE
jgi:hypothetical protein